MQATRLAIPEVVLLAPKVFGDARGFFFESFNQAAFDQATGTRHAFVQDNHSRSSKGVLRGLHYQKAPHAQGKLVRVTHGATFDVAVDLRQGSPTFGKWFGIELSAANHKMLWIPEGFAHGFLALEDNTHVHYKTTTFYHKESEGSLRWNDPDLAIRWPAINPLTLNRKDAEAPLLADIRHKL